MKRLDKYEVLIIELTPPSYWREVATQKKEMAAAVTAG